MRSEKDSKILDSEDQESLDAQLADLLLNKSLGEIAYLAETSTNMRTNALATLIYNAVFGSVEAAKIAVEDGDTTMLDPDISLINELIKRVDGAVPEADDRENYANIIGETINIILDMPKEEALRVHFTDIGVVAICKQIVGISMSTKINKNQTKKRERQVATEILLSRVGGRKSKPEQNKFGVIYEDRDFTKTINQKKSEKLLDN